MANNGVHRQEIGGIFQPSDQAKFMMQRPFHLFRCTMRIPPRHRFPDHLLQRLLRRQPRQGALLWVLVDQFLQRKFAAFRNFKTAGKRFRVTGKQPVHLFRRFHIAVGVALAAETGLIDGAIVPYAGDDILQHAPLRHMKQHIIGDNSRYTCG